MVGEEVVADAVQSEGGGEAAGFVNEGIQGDGGLILVAEAVVVHPVAAVGLHRPDQNKLSVRTPFKGGFVQNDRGRKPAELLSFWEVGAVDAGEIEDMAGFIYEELGDAGFLVYKYNGAIFVGRAADVVTGQVNFFLARGGFIHGAHLLFWIYYKGKIVEIQGDFQGKMIFSCVFGDKTVYYTQRMEGGDGMNKRVTVKDKFGRTLHCVLAGEGSMEEQMMQVLGLRAGGGFCVDIWKNMLDVRDCFVGETVGTFRILSINNTEEDVNLNWTVDK